jgi:hypothetical protein
MLFAASSKNSVYRRRGAAVNGGGEAHAYLFPLKEQEENSTTITAPMTELRIVDFTVPGGIRILKLPPMTKVRI